MQSLALIYIIVNRLLIIVTLKADRCDQVQVNIIVVVFILFICAP